MPKSVNRISFNNLYLVLLVFTLASGCALSLQGEGPSQHQHTSECRHELDREKRERFLLPVINDELLPPTVDNSAGPHITATLPLLHSLSTSSKKIYLNFVGCSTRNWGGYANAYSPAYDSDGNTASLSTAEANAITEIWKRVSEDFAPFNLDVTTEAPSSFTPATALEVCIGGSWSLWFGSSAGGVAYISSWLYGNTPVWVFEDNLGNGNAKYTAEAASHEVGHALGLSHQSTWSNTCVLTAQYSTGSGSGETGWAPIMGVGY